MRKVIFVNRYFYPDISATSQMLSDLAFAMRNSEYAIHVVTSRQRYDDPDISLPSAETLGHVKVQRVWTSHFGRKNLIGRACDYCSFYLSTFVALLMAVNEQDVLVTKTDPPLLSVIGLLICSLKGAHLINWLQDLFPEVARELDIAIPNPLYRLLIKLRNKSLNSAIANVAIGQLMSEKIAENGGEKNKIKVINNWAHKKKIWPVDHAANDLRKEWGLEDRFVVAYSGNMGRSHAFDAIMEAARILAGDQHIVFLFIGEGAKKAELVQQASTLGNIQFQPYQPIDNLANSLGVGDVHLISLMPQLEGLIVPSKFYGIIAAGRMPVFVGAADGELARIINAEEIGICITDDAKKLAEQIQLLSRDPVRVKQMGHNAYKYYQKTGSLEQAKQAWEKLLEAV